MSPQRRRPGIWVTPVEGESRAISPHAVTHFQPSIGTVSRILAAGHRVGRASLVADHLALRDIAADIGHHPEPLVLPLFGRLPLPDVAVVKGRRRPWLDVSTEWIE